MHVIDILLPSKFPITALRNGSIKKFTTQSTASNLPSVAYSTNQPNKRKQNYNTWKNSPSHKQIQPNTPMFKSYFLRATTTSFFSATSNCSPQNTPLPQQLSATRKSFTGHWISLQHSTSIFILSSLKVTTRFHHFIFSPVCVTSCIQSPLTHTMFLLLYHS